MQNRVYPHSFSAKSKVILERAESTASCVNFLAELGFFDLKLIRSYFWYEKCLTMMLIGLNYAFILQTTQIDLQLEALKMTDIKMTNMTRKPS